MEEKEAQPFSNLKEYIVGLRKHGYPNSKIIEALKKVNWPDDVIAAAMREADTEMPPIPEKPEVQEKTEVASEKPESTETQSSEQPTTEEHPIQEQKKDSDEQKEVSEENKQKVSEEPKVSKESTKPEQRKFSLWGVVALLLSPIPFIGLGVAMTAWENIRKNNNSGGILAIMAMIINTGIILVLLYVIYQLFSLGPDKLAGLADWVNNKFNLLP